MLGEIDRTNVLDLALLWPGRFDQTSCMSPLDAGAREELFQSFIAPGADIELWNLGSNEISGNVTSAEIESACQEAAWIALRGFRSIDSNVNYTNADAYNDEGKSLLIAASNSDDTVKSVPYDNNNNDFRRIQ